MAQQTLKLSASGLFTKMYGSNEIKDSSTARQGMYKSYATPGVGVIRFAGLADVNWKSKAISSIDLMLMHGASGQYSGGNKTFGLWPSNYQQDADTTMPGSAWINGRTVLGEFARPCKANTAVYINLSTSTDAGSLDKFAAYLKSGKVDTFCLYMADTLASGASYTTNYLSVTDAEITITYDDAASGVNYGNEGEWKPCMVNYGVSGKWIPCTPWYGLNGAWVPLGTAPNDKLTFVTYPAAAMTSNNSQNCVASASSTYGSSYPAWQAFDNEETKAWASSSDTGTQWIQLKMPQALKQITVEVHSRTSASIANPVAGQVLGSNNGSTWTPIGSYSGWSKTQRGGKLGEIVCNNDTAYSYVRLTITDRSYDGHDYVAIGYITITGGV